MRSPSSASLLILGCFFSRGINAFLLSTTVASGARSASLKMASAASAKKPKLADDVPSVLVEHAVAWAAANGLGMVVKSDEGLFTSSHLPFSLMPYGERIFLFCLDLRVLYFQAKKCLDEPLLYQYLLCRIEVTSARSFS